MQNEKEYKVVIQLTQNEREIQKSTLSQVNNILKAIENVNIELVTHSLGIEMLFEEAHFANSLEKLNRKGVRFLVCQNALQARSLHQEDLLPFAKIIPSAVAHLIKRQAEGWSYLRMA